MRAKGGVPAGHNWPKSTGMFKIINTQTSVFLNFDMLFCNE